TILRAIARGWREDRPRLVAEAEKVVESLRDHAAAGAEPAAGALAEAAGAAFEKAYRYYAESFDPAHGGFGGAPKFPRPANLDFLLRCAVIQGLGSEAGREACGMVSTSLGSMAKGGIHDHVGGGFHRYSVDAEWFLPHFEKMLYDQAQIACAALEAWRATGDELPAWRALRAGLRAGRHGRPGRRVPLGRGRRLAAAGRPRFGRRRLLRVDSCGARGRPWEACG